MSNQKKIDSKFIVSSIMFTVPVLLGAIFYKQLPDEMAVHFNSQNVADGFAPKWVALFGIPLFMLVIHSFSIFMMQNDPKKSGHSKAVKGIMYWCIPVLAVIMQIAFIAYGLGKSFNIATYVFAGVGVLTIILGNYLPKSRQNYSIGIKLPWTLSNEENWNKTHRMAGKLWIICGFLMTLLAVLGYPHVLVLIIAGMVIVPTIYSFTLYKKSQRA